MGTWVHPGYSTTTCLRVRVLRHKLSAGTGTGALAVPGFRVRLRVQEGLADLRVDARPRLGGGVLITSDTRFVTDITFFVFFFVSYYFFGFLENSMLWGGTWRHRSSAGPPLEAVLWLMRGRSYRQRAPQIQRGRSAPVLAYRRGVRSQAVAIRRSQASPA